MTAALLDSGVLADRWRADRAEHPRSYARDAAARLGVAEAQLVATACGTWATRLRHDWPAFAAALPTLGPVKTMTRNDHAVIEKDGTYADVSLTGEHGLALGELDLRFFPKQWGSLFATAEPQADGSHRRAIQLFDRQGVSVHKLFVGTDPAAIAAFDAMTTALSDPRQDAAEPVEALPPADAPMADADVDVAAFRAGWDALTDTHDFWKLLRTHRLQRTQALRLAGPARARAVSPEAFQRTLEYCASAGRKLMLFAGNRGALQVVSGQVHRIVRTSGWLNVLDPGFNLHLRDTAIAEAWVVHKATSEGIVSSLEAFDSHGETVLMLHGYRKDGAAACAPWERWLAALPEVA